MTFTVPGKLVYSTHDYGTSVHAQSWLTDSNFPANLPAVWDKNWGFLLKQNTAPVLVGDSGYISTNQVDQVWAKTLSDYMTLNGGILKDDGVTVDSVKQLALNPLLLRN